MKVGRHRKENFYRKSDFIAYLQNRDLASATINHYLWDLGLFLAWVKKEETNITKADVLKYLEHLKNSRQQQNISRSNALNSINHYFTFLLKAEAVESNPAALLKIRGTKKKTLYRLYSPEELQQLYDNYFHIFIQNFDDHCFASKLGGIPANQRKQTFLARNRNAAMLSILIHQGATTKELEKILPEDIDFAKATIRIRGGKRSDERILPLKAAQIGLLMHYMEKIRPQFFEYCSDSGKLFFTLPECSKKSTESTGIMHTFKPFTQQLKSIDKNLLNFKQVRASVIVQWLKTEGLRKTQYLAGHRYISSTEKYVQNNLESLTDDITKLHPF